MRVQQHSSQTHALHTHHARAGRTEACDPTLRGGCHHRSPSSPVGFTGESRDVPRRLHAVFVPASPSLYSSVLHPSRRRKKQLCLFAKTTTTSRELHTTRCPSSGVGLASSILALIARSRARLFKDNRSAFPFVRRRAQVAADRVRHLVVTSGDTHRRSGGVARIPPSLSVGRPSRHVVFSHLPLFFRITLI